MTLHRHVPAQVAELDLDQLLGVEGSVPVAAGAHGLRQDDPGRVDGLEKAPAVDAPRDLLDEDGSEALGAQLLVHAQEVDLRHPHDLLVDGDAGRHAGDEADELSLVRATADVPLLQVARRHQRPPEELGRVIEPEKIVVIFHVILVQKNVKLFQLKKIEVFYLHWVKFISGGVKLRERQLSFRNGNSMELYLFFN